MSNIEIGDYDNSDYLIDSFRKMVERHGGVLKDDSRIVLFKKLLVNLKTKEYNFSRILKSLTSDLNQLQNEKRHRWYPTSIEVIPFDYWLLQKNINSQYSHRLALASWKKDF
jgi:hypothetical protein